MFLHASVVKIKNLLQIRLILVVLGFAYSVERCRALKKSVRWQLVWQICILVTVIYTILNSFHLLLTFVF